MTDKKYLVHVEASYTEDVWVEAENEVEACYNAKEKVKENLNDGVSIFLLDAILFPGREEE